MRRHPMAWALSLTCPLAHAQASADTPRRSIGVGVISGEAPSLQPRRIPTTIEGATDAQIERTINCPPGSGRAAAPSIASRRGARPRRLFS